MQLFTTRRARLVAAKALLSLMVALGLLAWAGCDTVGSSADEPAGSNPVSVGFSMTSASAKAALSGLKAGDATGLALQGTNGTLAITDIRLIVSEMKLKVDDDSAGEGPEFETPPSFLDLPLDTTKIAAVADAEIPEDAYDRFEFEVEDVDTDDEDLTAEAQAQIEALFDTIRADYPSWPKDASMVITGTFTSADGGEPVEFTTYFEAEIEIELELSTS